MSTDINNTNSANAQKSKEANFKFEKLGKDESDNDLDITDIDFEDDESEYITTPAKVKRYTDPNELKKLIESFSLQSTLTEIEINNLINAKVKELSGLVNKPGACYIIANELNIKLDTKNPLSSKYKRTIQQVHIVNNIKLLISKLKSIEDYFKDRKFDTSYLLYHHCPGIYVDHLEDYILELGGFFEYDESYLSDWTLKSNKLISDFLEDINNPRCNVSDFKSIERLRQ